MTTENDVVTVTLAPDAARVLVATSCAVTPLPAEDYGLPDDQLYYALTFTGVVEGAGRRAVIAVRKRDMWPLAGALLDHVADPMDEPALMDMDMPDSTDTGEGTQDG